MTFISGFRRSIVAAGGVTLSVVLAACSGGAGDESPASGSQSTETSSSQTTPGVDIANPKDATAVDVCSLLPEEAAQKLGVQAQGEKESNLTSSESSTEPCVWESEYGATSVSLAPLSNSSIKQYLDGSDSYSDFKELTISGHPAVRANRNDPMTGGSCNIFLASKQGQVVQSYSRLNSEDTGNVDPCVKAKRTLELSVSSWPVAK
ncbi:DUF3558 domain-containing protein [Actinopolyspora saharensis]|uniref:DUF3558 domain-containing protein n=1 Tax=Actinopolyspora saharensis TaxID=995062 RepID=UPI000B8550AD